MAHLFFPPKGSASKEKSKAISLSAFIYRTYVFLIPVKPFSILFGTVFFLSSSAKTEKVQFWISFLIFCFGILLK